jgi:hypothetical protein
MYAPPIGPAIDLVFFESHRLPNQKDSVTICTACNADIVLCIIRPTIEEIPQSRDFHRESVYRDTVHVASDDYVAIGLGSRTKSAATFCDHYPCQVR